MGTYGYVYQATLEPKRPEHEKEIEFHVIQGAIVEEDKKTEKLQWYVEEGTVVEEISDEESIVEIPRTVSPPRHPELTAEVEVTPAKAAEPPVRIQINEMVKKIVAEGKLRS